jgi:glycerol uptake facilitator-like aquaporin
MKSDYTLPQKLLAEFLGTAALLCAVIGSGIMVERLGGGNNGVVPMTPVLELKVAKIRI